MTFRASKRQSKTKWSSKFLQLMGCVGGWPCLSSFSQILVGGKNSSELRVAAVGGKIWKNSSSPGWVRVGHAFNLSTQEAEAGGTLWIRGQPVQVDLVKQVPGQKKISLSSLPSPHKMSNTLLLSVGICQVFIVFSGDPSKAWDHGTVPALLLEPFSAISTE